MMGPGRGTQGTNTWNTGNKQQSEQQQRSREKNEPSERGESRTNRRVIVMTMASGLVYLPRGCLRGTERQIEQEPSLRLSLSRSPECQSQCQLKIYDFSTDCKVNFPVFISN